MNKYRNVKTVVDNITFDSKKEAHRYGELKLLEKAGEIYGLDLQPQYLLQVGGEKIGIYKADFRYIDRSVIPNKIIVEDCKGIKTPVYKIKKKLMKAIYGIDILET